MQTDLTDCIGFLATDLRDELSATFDERIKEFSLTHKQAGLLWRCYKQKHSQTSIYNFIHLDKNYIRFLIDDLEAKELVFRQKNPENRRENIIYLTQKGEELALKTFKLMLEVQDELMLSCMSKEEQKILHELLLRLFKQRHQTKE
ncbi:MarR family transcriptional regulator [Campylobacter sp. MIT 12-8780]|uniref:MarR family winged helix-turn-helix transcriptional regulator n=1 Tax=unclassified Campylobacter TaxID=2593542 RepID=UPI00115F0ED8|nr:MULTISPECIES: MarR family winged helix-turn-helix transcriptional regulator [unclassified Campylobacter]NDJ27056.1 winged helix-turn-helix transcriptional regulator [Campylobacter sp. MIT 19-121]TQR41643.1 MarR family transcriptional regulator [Campylobacter sp. MIT 12-8780]